MKGSEPVGRGEVLRRLSPLPTCSLIKAPASTGKRTVAEYLADQAGIFGIDRRLIPVSYWRDDVLIEPELSVDMVRDMMVWARTAPRTPAGKLAIIRLDHERVDGTTWRAHPRCITALLKTLEEPPPGVRFVLLASGPVAPVIVSRSVCVSAGLLSSDEVAEVLHRISDLDRMAATEVAALSAGRIAPALAVRSGVVGAREAVLGVLGDLAIADAGAAISRAREWTSAHTALLTVAAHECVSGRYRVFSQQELSVLPLPDAMSVLTVARRVQGARPRLVLGAVVAALSG